MKKILILCIILGAASSIPCYSKGFSVRKLAEFEEYQGNFHLTVDGFASVSDRKVLTSYVWHKEQNSFRKTDSPSRIFYLDLPKLKPQKNEQTHYSFNISNPHHKGLIVVQLVILPQKRPGRFDLNRDFYIEVLLNGKNVFKSEMMNGVVENFLGADITKDSANEIVLEYAGVGGSGYTMTFVVYKLEPESRQ